MRNSNNLSSLDIYNSKTIFKNIHVSPSMRKTFIDISLIVNYKLNYKDDKIKLHMKSLSAALVPNRTARFSHVIDHESQIYTLFTQTHTYKGQTGVQFHKHLYLKLTHTIPTTQPSHSCIYCKSQQYIGVNWCKRGLTQNVQVFIMECVFLSHI